MSLEHLSQYNLAATSSTVHGEAAAFSLADITNEDFIEQVFSCVPEGASVATCTKREISSRGGWRALPASAARGKLVDSHNNYVGCSSFYLNEQGGLRANAASFAAVHFFMLDDIGVKVDMERVKDLPLSWLIETSPGNHQAGLILAAPLIDGVQATKILNAIVEAGFCDPGSNSPMTRWARLPCGVNGKKKYLDVYGATFKCRLVEWHPERRYSVDEIVEMLGLDLHARGRCVDDIPAPLQLGGQDRTELNDGILIPKPTENPVLTALKERGLYKRMIEPGKHDITCPWVSEHTDALDSGAAFFEPSDTYPSGGFCCQHSHRDVYKVGELLSFLGVSRREAKHKPTIRPASGELYRVVRAAERVLSETQKYFQFGGLLVCVREDPLTNDPFIQVLSNSAVNLALSEECIWERYVSATGEWRPQDPPANVVKLLHEDTRFRFMPPLSGLARQPFFREQDGSLVMAPGYDPVTKRMAVFDAKDFVIPEPAREAVEHALVVLKSLLDEFCFVSEVDRSAALAAMFTAVVRPSIALAPAFHVHAPVSGSGKTYLCELIGAFAGPGLNAKVSYPVTPEEATKTMLSILLGAPAVIEFDDMSTDWLPHGSIKRMLTAETITDRILGVSKTATVSTRTLILGSGNNVGPIKDLLRRVVTIYLDPRVEAPGTKAYADSPVERVRKNRGHFVSAVLTIIQAWRAAGMVRTEATPIVSFGGAWADYCRHPLIWMGLPDPASALVDQMQQDPDADLLKELLCQLQLRFASTVFLTSDVLDAVNKNFEEPLAAALSALGLTSSGDPAKRVGKYFSRNVNRITGGLTLKKSQVLGRTGWRVVRADEDVPVSSVSAVLSLPMDGTLSSGSRGSSFCVEDLI